MTRKRILISTGLMLLILIVAYSLFRKPTLKYNGFSTSPNGVSLASATFANPDFYAVKIGDQYGYIDQLGTVVIPPRFTFAMTHFFNGLARVRSGGKVGFIDSSGDWIIQPQFDRAEDFSENLAAASFNGKYGYIDLSGSFVYPPQFDGASKFSNGVAYVMTYRFRWMNWLNSALDGAINGDWYHIDMRGNRVSSATIKVMPPTRNTHDIYPFRQGGLWGLSTFDDEVIVPPIYEYIQSFHGPLAEFTDNGVRGYINYKGEVVWPKKD